MIHKESEGFIVECDQCSELLDATHIDRREGWQELMQYMRQNGWTKMKVSEEDNTWEHYCKECSDD